MAVGHCLSGRLVVSLNCACRKPNGSFLTPPLSTVFQLQTLKSVVNNPEVVKPKPIVSQPVEEKKGLSSKIAKLFGKKEEKSMFRKISDVLNENSKVIVVEGTVATNKSEFAQKLAKEFGMYYFPDVSEKQYFFSLELGHDFRTVNEVLPDGKKFVDLKTFHSSPNPEQLGIVLTQALISRRRMENYLNALCHVLVTGQGVVVDRCVFSDYVYVLVLKQYGYMNQKMLETYFDFYNCAIRSLLRPHLYVYLTAPVEHIRDRIEKRGVPYEVKSKIQSDKFLKSLDNGYGKAFFPKFDPYSEVLKYDVSKLPEWKEIVQDIEKLDLTSGREMKFKDWKKDEKYMEDYRKNAIHYDINFEFWTDYLPRFWEIKDINEYFEKMKECIISKKEK